MSVSAVIPADLDTTPLGTRSRLADELCGVPVLRRTVQRVTRCEQIDAVIVTCPPAQHGRCAALLAGLPVRVQAVDAETPPWRTLVTSARKWALDGWRGGIGGTTCFDEYVDARVLAGLLGEIDARALFVVAPGAVVFDSDLADRMIAHGLSTREESKLTFAQTPPGLSGLLLNDDIVRELAEQSIPIGWVFSYKPDSPLKDLAFQPCCFEVPPEVRYATGRLIADTDRTVARLKRLLSAYSDPDARTTGRWLIERDETHVDALPREIELELTTDDPYPESVLRPRGPRLDRSGQADVELVERVIDDWCRFDDTLLVLGGFGDPLRHPAFDRILALASRGLSDGTRGLCVRTTAVDLDETCIDTIIEHPFDVLSVALDAWTAERYASLQSPGATDRSLLDAVVGHLDRLAERRIAHRHVTPIVVPEFTKAEQNVDELDAFHDGWLRKVGAVCITGAGHYAGQCPNHAVMNMAPPARTPCRRIVSRCMVLCDGRVVACDQDFRGLHPLGNLNEQPLETIWSGESFMRMRSAHQALDLSPFPLCGACDEWHRP